MLALKRAIYVAGTLICLASPELACAAGVALDPTKTQEVILQPGINNIEAMADTGAAGTIVVAWRGNGNAHGYHSYMVLLDGDAHSGGAGHPSLLVPVEDKTTADAPFINVINDVPHTFDDVITSVRFFRSRIGGKPAFLLIIAARDLGKAESLISPAPVAIDIYRLRSFSAEEPGRPIAYFENIRHLVSAGTYCHADKAVATELKLPLPRDYAGPATANGCL